MAMKLLLILNDPPYGTERGYNALRLAHALAKKDAEARIVVFLMADAVLSAKAGQKTPEGFYNVERMLKRVLASGGQVLLCGTCMDARGIVETELMEGARRSTMDELALETLQAGKTLVF
jgi:uncharacterized protein involved in oxidation of intracellular sulfur